MIFTDYSQHIPKITASPVCTAIKNTINGIKLCLSFSRKVKFQAVYFKNAPASGGLRPQTPCRLPVEDVADHLKQAPPLCGSLPYDQFGRSSLKSVVIDGNPQNWGALELIPFWARPCVSPRQIW